MATNCMMFDQSSKIVRACTVLICQSRLNIQSIQSIRINGVKMLLISTISIILCISSTISLDASTDTHLKPRNSSNLRQRESSEEDLEMALRYMERKRLSDLTRDFRENNIKVVGFFHTSKWKNHWESVIGEQLRLMEGSRFKSNTGSVNDKWGTKYWASLLELVDFLHLTIAGSDKEFAEVSKAISGLNLKFKKKVKIYQSYTMERDKYRYASDIKKKELRLLANKNNLTEGEYYTINSLHQYCKNQKMKNEKTFIFYAHSKGGCCPRGSKDPVTDWRDEMNAFNLEFPSTCLRALRAGYSTCGAEYQDAHYSGNFWWSTCDHIAALPGLWDPIDNAYACEYFVFNVSYHHHIRTKYAEYCGYNMFHCHVNHYDTRCPRKQYIHNLSTLVFNDILPISPASRRSKSSEWVRQKCPGTYKRPFQEQVTWRGDDNDWWGN